LEGGDEGHGVGRASRRGWRVLLFLLLLLLLLLLPPLLLRLLRLRLRVRNGREGEELLQLELVRVVGPL
jgi:hypothetical protein